MGEGLEERGQFMSSRKNLKSCQHDHHFPIKLKTYILPQSSKITQITCPTLLPLGPHPQALAQPWPSEGQL